MRVRFCVHHEGRNAHALCMSCRQPICQECTTEWDGINYCVTCLGRKRAAKRSGRSPFGWLALLIVATLLFMINARLLLHMSVFMAEVLR
ncbi:MAG: B-box zinc finger protein [Vicinamibacteria bacterium]|nr:B-box zinc finger protein [Vicinamibacteria bacterium]